MDEHLGTMSGLGFNQKNCARMLLLGVLNINKRKREFNNSATQNPQALGFVSNHVVKSKPFK